MQDPFDQCVKILLVDGKDYIFICSVLNERTKQVEVAEHFSLV